ncbi:MAG: radical SAM family heme chaperone HemW [Bacillota bacterium]|nr:radical SAM family heme chaperone HemW [Bacillota bacterium]
MKGIYIHIPFCKKKCNYCHFVSKTDLTSMDEYIDALLSEILLYKDEMDDIKTIYIGGGTPSLLSCEMVEKIVDNLNLHEVEEFTIEVNPESVTTDKLLCYKKSGINRISMGVQTTNESQLKTLGRLHSFNDVKEKYQIIRDAGFDNINLDLIYALPGQKTEDLLNDIKEFSILNPKHISTYSLMYEEGTVLDRMKESGEIKPVSDETDREYFHIIESELKKNGYHRYEISNFSKEGYESKHNLLYWSADEYIGLGLSAHGYLGGERYANESVMEEYLKKIKKGERPVSDVEKIGFDEEKFEYIMLNLRKTEGFSIEEFKERFDVDFLVEYKIEIEKMIEYGALVVEMGRVHLTDYGFDVSNKVYGEFLR